MVSVGMIFQYDSEQGIGQIMFADGDKREFSSENWIDNANLPRVGQKVFYDNSNGQAEVKMASEEDQITPSPEEATADEDHTGNWTTEFDNIDDYISHYTSIGFKLAKDMTKDQTRTIALRKYTVEEFAEITVTQKGSEIHETRMLNGVTI